MSTESEQKNEQEEEKQQQVTKLVSKELLTNEEIKEAGIGDDDVQLYRMKKFKEAFSLDKWLNIPELNALTFPTRIIPVTADEANSFLLFCRYTQSKLAKHETTYKSQTQQEYEQQRVKIDGDIQRIKEKITLAVRDANWAESGFFAKFNTRSPKDVHGYEGQEKYVTDVFYAEMDRFKARGSGQTGQSELEENQLNQPQVAMNEALIASYTARARLLRMQSADDVINTFARSFRSLEDLQGALRLGDEHADISIALRQWNDAVPYNGHGEFRCFVHNKEMNAITQYISCIWYKGLARQQQQLQQRILEFYERKVKAYVPMDSFVVDFLVLYIELDEEHDVYREAYDRANDGNDGIHIIEFNPFYKHAGSGLFDWKTDRELFLNGPCQLRVRDELDPQMNEYFHPSWLKSYQKYNGVDAGKSAQHPPQKKICIIL